MQAIKDIKYFVIFIVVIIVGSGLSLFVMQPERKTGKLFSMLAHYNLYILGDMEAYDGIKETLVDGGESEMDYV